MTWLSNHWLDVLGWGGSALLVYSLLQARVLRFRTLNLLASTILMIFNAFIEVWPMVAMNAVLAGINVYFIIRLVRERHDDTGVRRDRGRHRRPLPAPRARRSRRRHPRFQPDLDWRPGPDRHAFVVVKGDETVGVVLLRADGDVARIALDYVTPRYRDFSPGEFVWRRSGVLRERGFSRVVTPPGMVGAYYDRLGFRREGGTFVLDL